MKALEDPNGEEVSVCLVLVCGVIYPGPKMWVLVVSGSCTISFP